MEDYETLYNRKWINPTTWDNSKRRNTICDVCGNVISYCPSMDTACSLCNVVAHIACLKVDQLEHTYRGKWVCEYCYDDIQYSKDMFIDKKCDTRYSQVSEDAQIMISKYWRRYTARKLYLKTYSIIILIQRIARTWYRRKLLTSFRKYLLRPLNVRIVKCHDLPTRVFPNITITVVDTTEHNLQSWLLQSKMGNDPTDPEFNEDILIPGINGNQTLVFTVTEKYIGKTSSVGQASLNIGRNDVWRRGGKFMLHFGPIKESCGIRVLPQHAIKPAGTIEICVEPYNDTGSTCGYITSPAIEDLLRAFRAFAKSTTAKVSSEEAAAEEEREMAGGHFKQAISHVTTRKHWVVIANDKVYLHRKFTENCKIIIDLDRTSLCIENKLNKLYYILKLTGIPPLEFVALSNYEVLRWKVAFTSAWKHARVGDENNITSLVQDLLSSLKDEKSKRGRRKSVEYRHVEKRASVDKFTPRLPHVTKAETGMLIHDNRRVHTSSINMALHMVA